MSPVEEDGLIWLRTLTKRMTPPEFDRLADEDIINMGREFRMSDENIISRLMAVLKISAV